MLEGNVQHAGGDSQRTVRRDADPVVFCYAISLHACGRGTAVTNATKHGTDVKVHLVPR